MASMGRMTGLYGVDVVYGAKARDLWGEQGVWVVWGLWGGMNGVYGAKGIYGVNGI